MRLVDSTDKINNNLATFNSYLCGQDSRLRDFAKSLIKNGRCFVVLHSPYGIQFSPSKFVGYENNSAQLYTCSTTENDGRDSNTAIGHILNQTPHESPDLESEFQDFALSHDVQPAKHSRKYWELNCRFEWQDWLPFPAPNKGMYLRAPFGPGVYQLRNVASGELVLFGTGKNCASRMSSLLPPPLGTGTRNNSQKREYVAKNINVIEYRCAAFSSIGDAKELERELKKTEHLFNT